MAVEITLPRNAEYAIREVSRIRALTPAFGGPESMINRIGSRSAMDVGVPVISAAGCGSALVADLLRARTEGALIAIPEPKLAIQPYGAALVKGGSQVGSTINLDGLNPRVIIPKGKWLSVIISGRRFAYLTTALVVADGAGEAALPIWPMIRRSPADNAVIELEAPKMEGFVQNVVDRSVRRIGAIGLSFTVTERE